jgi:TolA-binding protein
VLTLLHGGQSASQLKDWKTAEAMLASIPAKHADTPLLPEALYELGWARQNSGKADEALKNYEAAATKSRDHVGARARFMMGELLFGQKKHDDALREFQRAMFGFGGEQAAAETKNWQAKSGYEAGRCAEVQIAAATNAAAKQKLIADARRFYTFVVEKHAGHELAGEAKKRLEALGKL